MTKEPCWGAPFDPGPDAKMVLLHWRAQRLSASPSESVEVLHESLRAGIPGVYCIEGRHDARHVPSPLYIGLAGRELSDRLKVEKGSLGHFAFATLEPNGPSAEFFADVWDVTVRWAEMAAATTRDIEEVEALLIRSHKPGYNQKHVSGTDSGNLVVINLGAKGSLLPVLASRYFAPAEWWAKVT